MFDWFVLSMRMQVILDSSFARPGSAPIRGGKKGEFRDWTNCFRAANQYVFGQKNPFASPPKDCALLGAK